MENTRTTTELQEAADNASKKVRDPEAMRKASQRMDALRETVKRRAGTVSLGVEIIRELRDQ